MPQQVQQMMLVVGFGVMALIFAAAIWQLWRQRRPWILLMMGVALLTLPLEGIAEYLGKCLMPTVGQIEMYTLLGKHVPLYVLPMFQLMLVLNVLVLMKIFDLRLSKPKFMGVHFLICLIVLSFGFTWIKLGFLRYYGNQPLLVFSEVPVWVSFLDTSLGFWAAAIFHFFKNASFAPKPIFVLIVAPILLTSLYMGCNLPVAWALYSQQSAETNAIGGLVTILLAVITTYFAYAIVCWVDQQNESQVAYPVLHQ
jgi:hypothetical protein